MAIYKLGEIGTFKGGISTLNKNNYSTNSGVLFVNYMDIFKNISLNDENKNSLKKYIASKKDIEKFSLEYGDILFTASSETKKEIAFSTVILFNDLAIYNGFSKKFSYNQQILNPKYAAYFFRSAKFRGDVVKYATGYTRYNISQKDLMDITIDVPNKIDQQKIIDIIEPIEKMIDNKKKLGSIIDNLNGFIANNLLRKTNTNLIEKVDFNKGKTIKSEEFKESGSPFIDIRMLNSGAITKCVIHQPNTFDDDILLSLDATVGIVKTNITGFNGYAYNIKSNYLSKYEIYLNLICVYNQSVISSNSSGTTIKHASKSKEKMIYHESDIEVSKIEPIFELSKNIAKSLKILEKIREKQIKLLVR